jgi:exodeoxyribonuclease VIII
MNIMIDLETMGLRPTSAIISIGAVAFDQSSIVGRFYTNVSLESCKAHGLTTDISTEKWWANQSAEARNAWDRPDAPSLIDGMTSFHRWIQSVESNPSHVIPWGNGADFDIVLMNNAYNAIGADPHWRYWNYRCFRTMKGMFPLKSPPARVGDHHNALNDAETQVNHLHGILMQYNLRLP